MADFLEFAQLMATDALERDESCGAHFREDHPTASDLQTSRYTVVRMRGDDIEITTEPVHFTRVAPGQSLLDETPAVPPAALAVHS